MEASVSTSEQNNTNSSMINPLNAFKYKNANIQQKTNCTKKFSLENLFQEFSVNAVINNHHNQTLNFKPKTFCFHDKLNIKPNLKFGISGKIPYNNLCCMDPKFHLNFYEIFGSRQNLKAMTIFKAHELDRMDFKAVYDFSKKKYGKKTDFSFDQHKEEEKEMKDAVKFENQENTQTFSKNLACNIIYKKGIVLQYPNFRTNFEVKKWKFNASVNPKLKLEDTKINFFKHYYKIACSKDFLKKDLSAKFDFIISATEKKSSSIKKSNESDSNSNGEKLVESTDLTKIYENEFNDNDLLAKISGPVKVTLGSNLNYKLVKIPRIGDLSINLSQKLDFQKNKLILGNWTSKLNLSKNPFFGNAYLNLPQVNKQNIESQKNTKINIKGNKSLKKYGKFSWTAEIGKKPKFSVCYQMSKYSGLDGKICINDIKLQ